MNIEELREYCLKKRGVEETFPFDADTLVYKVMGKAFLLTGLSESSFGFNVKCDPEKAVELRERYSCVLPGYHMNKKHWNTITPDGSVADEMVYSWVDDSYTLVVAGLPKRLKEKLVKKKS
jgi:predicted DNA-binding protein (MmcQ/YjbR family)